MLKMIKSVASVFHISIKTTTIVVQQVGGVVPYAPTVMQLVQHLMEVVENVEKNKDDAKRLAERCQHLSTRIEKFGTEHEKDQDGIYALRNELMELIKNAVIKLHKWDDTSWFKRFFTQDSIAKEITRFEKKMDTLVESFHISTGQTILQNQKNILSHLSKGVPTISHHKQNTTILPTLQDTPGDAFRTSIYWQPKEYLRSDITLTAEVHQSATGPYRVYQGSCPDLQACALKRLLGKGNDVAKKRFIRQIEVWKKATIADAGVRFLPLVGYVMEEHPNQLHYYTVTPWMRNGSAADVFSKNSRHDGATRRLFILKLVKGLVLLHQLGLIHGYIKASHIIVSDLGEPMIGDFGLSRPEEETKINMSSLPSSLDYLRWIPREMMEENSLNSESSGSISQKADVFMFGMTALEIMTGNKPFAEISNERGLLGERTRNTLPQRPVGEGTDAIDDSLWELLLRCWALELEDRPTMLDVLNELERERK